MGSVGFDGEGEYRSSTSYGNNHQPPKRLRDACGELDLVSVPRKQRSAIKKQRRESVTPPLPISRKRHMWNCTEKLRKNGVKKSILDMRQGHITRDEEEVAETLNALADMFSDANQDNQPGFSTEPSEMKCSAALETEDARIREEGSRRITSTVTIEAVSHSSVLNSMHQEVDFQCAADAQQPELPARNKPVALRGNQPENMGQMSRVSTIDTVPSVKEEITPKEVTVPTTQSKKNFYPVDERKKGIYLSTRLPAKELINSETQGSCLCLPAWFGNTPSASQPCVIEESTIAENIAQAPLESLNSWKRCSAHVYISRLIKILQLSEKKESSIDMSTPRNKMMGVTGSSTREECFSGITQFAAGEESTDIQNVTLSHERSLQDQQLTSEISAISSSTNQCYNFLSLHTGAGNFTSSEIISRTKDFPEVPKQFQTAKLQNHASVRFSTKSRSGYSSTFHGHNSMLTGRQVQFPQYISSASNLPTHYNTRFGSLHLPGWRNGGDPPSLQNYACAIFPHLHPVLSSRHQQLSTPGQMFASTNTSASSLPLSNMKIRHQHQLPLQTERNGATLYHENIRQLQLPCNENFWK